MCGPETPSTTPRVGARVDFFSPPSLGHLPLGNLLFLNPSSPASSHATHIRFHQSPKATSLDESVLVSIHLTGDLNKPLSDSGLMQQFTLHHTPTRHSHSHSKDGIEVPLSQAVSLNVGNDGIIGRRVSMRRGAGGELLADGIVGFNFMPVVAA